MPSKQIRAAPTAHQSPREEQGRSQHPAGFWQSFLQHRRAVKLKKVEAKTAMNYNNVLLGIIVIIGIALLLVGAVIIVFLHTLQAGFYKASGDILTLVSDHPAMAVAAYSAAKGHDSDAVTIAAILSEISAQGNVHGNFKGHWTTQQVRFLEKKNLSCREQYTYDTLTYSEEHAQFKTKLHSLMYDRSCEKIDTRKELRTYDRYTGQSNDTYEVLEEGYSLWRCPVYNCEMVEKQRTEPGEFIPESISITNVDIGYQGIGKTS